MQVFPAGRLAPAPAQRRTQPRSAAGSPPAPCRFAAADISAATSDLKAAPLHIRLPNGNEHRVSRNFAQNRFITQLHVPSPVLSAAHTSAQRSRHTRPSCCTCTPARTQTAPFPRCTPRGMPRRSRGSGRRRSGLSGDTLLHKAEHGEAPLYSGLHRILHNYFAIGPCRSRRSFYK